MHQALAARPASPDTLELDAAEGRADSPRYIRADIAEAAVQAAVAKAVEAEREACAEVAAEFVHRRLYDAKMPACSYHSRDIAAAIRARKGDVL